MDHELAERELLRLLDRLEALLVEERRAVITLDHAGLLRIANEKAEVQGEMARKPVQVVLACATRSEFQDRLVRLRAEGMRNSELIRSAMRLVEELTSRLVGPGAEIGYDRAGRRTAVQAPILAERF